jgi:nicotinic acid mononucleotide adenylyltransferase
MEFLWRGDARGGTLALFPGAWNPPTHAHLAMAGAALAFAPEVALVLARAMPHKSYEGPSFDQRAAWLRALCASRPGLSAAATDGGLFLDIAREARAATGASRILLVCGRDAAERIVNWDYGPGIPPIAQQLDEFELLVAPRNGPFQPPPELAPRIHLLHLAPEWEHVSSTAARLQRTAGSAWDHLVPAEIQDF